MKNILNIRKVSLIATLFVLLGSFQYAFASSHREAPLISNDPLADNVDLYAFRHPNSPNMLTIIATYVPMQLAHGGPNYYNFGEDIQYEIHIDNDVNTAGDDLVYRFSFNHENEDPTTFFNIRAGLQNLKSTYEMRRGTRTPQGQIAYYTAITNGIVPPSYIGDRSIESAVGLNTTYANLMNNAITQTNGGEIVFVGSIDDPFFVDLGGIFDLGDAPRQDGAARDGLACMNVSAICIQIPIHKVVKPTATGPSNILDSDFTVGIWASANRKKLRVLTPGEVSYSRDYVQVSRLGMPLTNEAIIPIGMKDKWNAVTPYEDDQFAEYFFNPELALYMDDDLFGGAVPAFSQLRIQENSLGLGLDFTNGGDGLFPLKGSDLVAGTALDDAIFGALLLPGSGMPRSVDLYPAFHTGVPNFPPYQLATGKEGNPLAVGKPFVNNFLPNGGDMLRINLAVPPTDRDDPKFSSLGLIQAAVLGLTDPEYNGSADLEFIPNMDGFPNGRRLEDDVTRIELQAVSGIVLAAIGLWYDDFNGSNPVTQDLLNVLTFTTGVEANDAPFQGEFPYAAMPWKGDGFCGGVIADNAAQLSVTNLGSSIGTTAPAIFGKEVMMVNYPNPFTTETTIRYQVTEATNINIQVFNISGQLVKTVVNSYQEAGVYNEAIYTGDLGSGTYFAKAIAENGELLQVLKMQKIN